MQACFILLQPALLPVLPPGGFEEGAVEDEAGLVLLGLPPGVVEGAGLVGSVVPPVDVLPSEVGWVVGVTVLSDGLLLPVGVVVWAPPVELGVAVVWAPPVEPVGAVVWAPPVELGVGVVWEPPVELGGGVLVGPMAVNLSFET